MLVHLRITNFALLEEIDIDFHKGLSCFTGETGAGKSILIDAILRLLGARAGQEDVRAGSSRSILEAIFDAGALSAGAKRLLEEWQIEIPEEGVIVRREIQATGKSRAIINNYSVTVLQLKQLGSFLMDVFGQHEHQTLLDSDSQRTLFDEAIGVAEQVNRLSSLAQRISILQQECKRLREREQQRQRNIDMLQYQIREIEEAKISEEEEQELISKRSILQNAEKIASICDSLLQQILESDNSVLGQIETLRKNIAELERYQPDFHPHLQKMNDWKEDLNEVVRETGSLRQRLDFEESSLDELESRIDLLQRLKKKYGPTISDVLQHLARSKEELNADQHAGKREEELLFEIRKAGEEYEKVAASISAERNRGRSGFSKRVENELKHVAMEKCRFRVDLPKADSEGGDVLEKEYPLFGRESVVFEIEPNPGEGFRELERIASGGELSRLMLALKIVTRKERESRCFIFDEIDAGIGGREAHRIGERLKRLSNGGQVLAVTHLPQVAAFGDHHFQVSKNVKSNRTITVVEDLGEPERIRELARMLSGNQITDTALQHARELREQVQAKSV